MSNTSLAQLIQEDDEKQDVIIKTNTSKFSLIKDGPSSLSLSSSSWNNKSSRINPTIEEVCDQGRDIDCGYSSGHDISIVVVDNVGSKNNEIGSNVEAWLPITESRNGNVYFCVFHLISSGLGVQSLALPFAFVSLGWVWGIMCLSIAFIWQLYTIWLLVRLHESSLGHRVSRYIQLAMLAFGPKRGKLLALFPIMYLSGGSCVMLIITGGSAMDKLHRILCEDGLIRATNSPTIVEWYLVFICLAIAIAQLPNLNSVAWVSLVSAITVLAYCSLVWIVSVSEGRPNLTEYIPVLKGPETNKLRSVMNVISAVGIISFSFRGHNLVLEIQGTLPASVKPPTHRTMWNGVTISYTLIALCLFPLAMVGFSTYGTSMPKSGILNAFGQFHKNHTSNLYLGVIYFFIIINSLCSFQVYAMLVFDNLEFRYISINKKPCTYWIRTGIRMFFGGLTFFISVALPFLPVLSPLLGAISFPITYAYPCFMWIIINKPKAFGSMWWLNLVLGCFGILASVMLVIVAILRLVIEGISGNFFHPKL